MKLLDHLPEHPAVSWVPFHPGHVLSLSDVRSKMFEQHAMISRLEAQASMGDAITAFLYGKPVACFGYSVIWTGVAEMWLYVDEAARRYGKTMTRAGLVFADYAAISANLHRLQISVECDDERAVRWGQVLGFEIEGRMRKFGPNQSDFFIMSKT